MYIYKMFLYLCISQNIYSITTKQAIFSSNYPILLFISIFPLQINEFSNKWLQSTSFQKRQVKKGYIDEWWESVITLSKGTISAEYSFIIQILEIVILYAYIINFKSNPITN